MAEPLRIPPESLWPTGATPPELRAAMHAEGIKTPEEVRAQPRYQPPPRPQPDLQALELERQLNVVAPPVVNLPPPPPGYLPPAPPSLVYSLPLGHGKHAEVKLYGPIGSQDIKLLLRHIKLMQSVEPPPVASRPPEPVVPLSFEPNGHIESKRPRKRNVQTQ